MSAPPSAPRMLRTSVAPLFVPGHRDRLRDKAAELTRDTLIVDLEDSVPSDFKDAARLGAVALIEQAPQRCLVRINPMTDKRFGRACGEEDIAAIVRAGLLGIVAPKIERRAELRDADTYLARAEAAAGIPIGEIGLMASIETPLGILNLAEIAQAAPGRAVMLSFGMGDFTTAPGVAWTADEAETAVPRAMVPIAAQAFGLAAPCDSVFVDVGNVEGLQDSARRGLRLGYGCKAAIHPSQIDVIRDIYRPSDAQIERAGRIVRAAEERFSAGLGAFLLDGEMIDEPIVVRARDLIARAETIQ